MTTDKTETQERATEVISQKRRKSKTNEEYFAALQAPIEYKWKVLNVMKNSNKCTVIPYNDARQIQQRFDDVFGGANWENTYDPETGAASISVLINDTRITKTDVGTEDENPRVSKNARYKGRASDAFKRAAVLFGVGREKYNIGTKVLSYDVLSKCPKTASGKKLYGGEQLTLYMNGLNESMGLLMQIWNKNKELHEDPEFLEVMTKAKKLLK